MGWVGIKCIIVCRLQTLIQRISLSGWLELKDEKLVKSGYRWLKITSTSHQQKPPKPGFRCHRVAYGWVMTFHLCWTFKALPLLILNGCKLLQICMNHTANKLCTHCAGSSTVGLRHTNICRLWLCLFLGHCCKNTLSSFSPTDRTTTLLLDLVNTRGGFCSSAEEQPSNLWKIQKVFKQHLALFWQYFQSP